MSNHTVLFLAILFFSLFGMTSFSLAQTIQVSGQVVDQQSQEPIEFATIVLAQKSDDQVIGGTTSRADGTFSIETQSTNFYVEISFIGYANQRIEAIEVVNNQLVLGTIPLGTDSKLIEEVVVRAEKSSTEFRLDKRVFNVGQDLSSTGASALEVLNNVPSVNVNIEGQVSLRGSAGVQILINGKPSVIASDESNALGTITADMIDKIEVITNPSAKYEAEGTSGIINIVIKKEDKKGLNGSVSVNTGTPNTHSIGTSLNIRTEKFNWFSQLGIGHRESPNTVESINQDFGRNTQLLSFGKNSRNEHYLNLVLGTDYYINRNNVITFSGNFVYEVEDQPSDQTFEFEDPIGSLLRSWTRTENTAATNPKFQFEMNYKRDFKDHKDHDLVFSALGNFFQKDLESEFFNTPVFGENIPDDQITATNFKESKYTFQLDYTRPITDRITIETGSQYVLNDVSNEFEVQNIEDGIFVVDPNFTNTFDYDQKVLGLYGTIAYEYDKWGVKVGLRAENTDLTTFLQNTGQENNQNFTNLFPSFHTSYKFTEAVSMQAGYSRRIRRPRLWDLNPFFNVRDNFNIRVGNPNLLPEFTDSYEVTSIFILDKVSFNVGAYYRNTTDVIERISFFEDNVNTTTPVNIGTTQAIGLEANGKYSATKWLSLNGDINYNYFSRSGELEQTVFDFTADQWTAKLTAKFKLPKGFAFETTGQFQSAVETVQGRQESNIWQDLGIRKKILNGRGIFNLSIRDVFASRVDVTEAIQPDFNLFRSRQRGRFISFGFSYGFGKGEAMQYSGQRRY
ncbi:MAG: outer membrane beta-barrel family protein [Bacteroidota bacterium]